MKITYGKKYNVDHLATTLGLPSDSDSAIPDDTENIKSSEPYKPDFEAILKAKAHYLDYGETVIFAPVPGSE